MVQILVNVVQMRDFAIHDAVTANLLLLKVIQMRGFSSHNDVTANLLLNAVQIKGFASHNCLGHICHGFLEDMPKTVMLEPLVDVGVSQMVDCYVVNLGSIPPVRQ